MKNKDLIEEMLKELPSFVKTWFFALYLGQRVFGNIDLEKPRILGVGDLSRLDNTDYLHLRDISDLTDGEKRILLRICNWSYKERAFQGFQWHIADNCVLVDCVGIKDFVSNKGIDYLRSIGILLPFLTIDTDGKPIKYSVNDIISLGWAKIKGNL